MIGPADRLAMTLRAFFIQAAWNTRGMQHMGFLFALRPALARIWGDSGERRMEAEQRQVTYFNTHPYFAPILVGVAARLEEDYAQGRLPEAKHIRLMVNRMSGPFAAVGDAFFWETIRPCLAFIGVWVVLAALPGDLPLATTGPILFLGAFNLFTLPFRFWGTMGGYFHGIGIIERLKRLRLQETMRRFRILSLVALGIYLGHSLTHGGLREEGLPPEAVSAHTWMIASAFLFSGLVLLIRGKVSPTRLLYGLIALGLIVSWVKSWI